MKKIRIGSALIILLTLVMSKSFSQHAADTFAIVPLCNLDLNRVATKLSAADLATVSPAVVGYKWNSGDATTVKWRPQGITGVNVGCKEFSVVSWYGRNYNYSFPCDGQNADYRDRGSRVSFVDITDMNNIAYRHVLLVDENYDTFYDMHAGGLVIINDTLYVPDSRSTIDAMYAFPLDQIKEVPAAFQSTFYNYGYILARAPNAIDSMPINPSFVSYDWDDEKMVLGSFQNCGPINCPSPEFNRLLWYNIGMVNTSTPYYDGLFGNMQGLGSANNLHNSNKKDIWVSTSYGAVNNSVLFTFNYDFGINTVQDQTVSIGDNYAKFAFPPGIEDIHLSPDNDTIWTLTEFSPTHPTCFAESSNERYVFGFKRTDISPPGNCNGNVTYTENTINDTDICSPTDLTYHASTDYVSYATFDKSDETWIELNALSATLAGVNRSMFMWMKQSTTVSSESQVLAGINTSTGGNVCNLQISTSETLGIYDGSTSHWGTTIVTDGLWHHVGYTYNEATGETKLYIDGSLELTYSNSQTISSTNLISLGQEFDSGLDKSNFFEGEITEVTIWNDVLVSSDINQLMTETVGSTHPKIQNLMAYYSMNKLCGDDLTIVEDISGNDFNGAAKGTIGTNGVNVLSVDQMDQLSGFNSIAYFTKNWLSNGTSMGVLDSLALAQGSYASGIYTLELTKGPFIITDDWTINIQYTLATDVQVSCGSYTWIDGNNYTTTNNNATHTLTNTAGCDSIVTLDLTVTNIDTTITTSGFTITSNQAGANYQWIDCNDNNSILLGEISQSYTNAPNGSYAVVITDGVCSDTSACATIVGVGFETLESASVVIYPNPNNGSFYVSKSGGTDFSLSLYSIDGRALIERIAIKEENQLINLQEIESGVYIARINHGKFSKTIQLVVN